MERGEAGKERERERHRNRERERERERKRLFLYGNVCVCECTCCVRVCEKCAIEDFACSVSANADLRCFV